MRVARWDLSRFTGPFKGKSSNEEDWPLTEDGPGDSPQATVLLPWNHCFRAEVTALDERLFYAAPM